VIVQRLQSSKHPPTGGWPAHSGAYGTAGFTKPFHGLRKATSQKGNSIEDTLFNL
jgi:hypothetical protein